MKDNAITPPSGSLPLKRKMPADFDNDRKKPLLARGEKISQQRGGPAQLFKEQTTASRQSCLCQYLSIASVLRLATSDRQGTGGRGLPEG
ncbi:hypothetical protein [Erwinia sp. 198]|uniref:hypothetical protein n=1 Tax=Erwinia sp. 198 TaxID=2022746 RepID=UPI000F68CA75|nr:hypothetical protein [Erwinia sp. 198]